jgi:choline dehydrogenase-like flavoprotein
MADTFGLSEFVAEVRAAVSKKCQRPRFRCVGTQLQATTCESLEHNADKDFQSAGHVMGTARMGTDARHAVVDANLRAFDHPNLFIEGSAVFPTVGAANPTLTIAALALRSVEAIRAALTA